MRPDSLTMKLAIAMEYHLGTALALDRAEQIALTHAKDDPIEFAAAMGRTQALAYAYRLPIPSVEDVKRAAMAAAEVLRAERSWLTLGAED